jgi:HK97 family phage prohead protease
MSQNVLKQLERRFAPRNLTLTATRDANGAAHAVGYAAVFNQVTRILDGFNEVVRPKAFERSLQSKKLDVIGTYNHSADALLGRTPDTLQLSEDSRGLRFDITLPDTQLARDLSTLIERGDVRGASFAFTVQKQKWTEEKTKSGTSYLRELLQLDLHDVSVVVTPAYLGTSVALRSLLFPTGTLPDGCPGCLRPVIVGRQKEDDDTDADKIVDDDDNDAEECQCRCERCVEGECRECDDPDCTDEFCEGCPVQEDGRARAADSQEAVAMRRRRLEVAFEESELPY